MRNPTFEIVTGDSLVVMSDMPSDSCDLIITSPPYNIGKEYEAKTGLSTYIAWQEEIARESVRILKPSGSLCWQVGNYIDKGEVFPLDILLYPAFKALDMRLRNRIMWTFGHGLHCSNRLSGRHETILWFSKGDKYTFNLDAIRVPSKYPGKKHFKGPKKGQLSGNPLGKNPSDVWDITNVKHNHPEKTEHPCQFPEAITDRLVAALCPEGGTVLDPFMGSGTTGISCLRFGRKFLGIDKEENYCSVARERLTNYKQDVLVLEDDIGIRDMHVTE